MLLVPVELVASAIVLTLIPSCNILPLVQAIARVKAELVAPGVLALTPLPLTREQTLLLVPVELVAPAIVLTLIPSCDILPSVGAIARVKAELAAPAQALALTALALTLLHDILPSLHIRAVLIVLLPTKKAA